MVFDYELCINSVDRKKAGEIYFCLKINISIATVRKAIKIPTDKIIKIPPIFSKSNWDVFF